MLPATTFAAENIAQRPNEKVTYVADFSLKLKDSETLASGATATQTEGDGTLTITSVAINASDVTDALQHTTPAGKGVAFTVAGASAQADGDNEEYTVLVKATTSTGDIREMACRITGSEK